MCDEEPTGVLAGRITSTRMRSGTPVTIPLNAAEIYSLHMFSLAHASCSNGGWPTRFDIVSTATGIGNHLEVKCQECGASHVFSDFESW